MHSYLLKVVASGETLLERNVVARGQSELWDFVAEVAHRGEIRNARGTRIKVYDASGGMIISVGVVSAREMARRRAA